MKFVVVFVLYAWWFYLLVLHLFWDKTTATTKTYYRILWNLFGTIYILLLFGFIHLNKIRTCSTFQFSIIKSWESGGGRLRSWFQFSGSCSFHFCWIKMKKSCQWNFNEWKFDFVKVSSVSQPVSGLAWHVQWTKSNVLTYFMGFSLIMIIVVSNGKRVRCFFFFFLILKIPKYNIFN